jgi:membrane fusion protein (multidrug efflux system)
MQMPPTPVEVADVTPTRMRDQFRAVGTIQPLAAVSVVSEINAVVRALPFQEGGTVSRGQVLARLDDTDLRAEAARAAALREQAKTASARAEKLHTIEAISTQGYDDARASLRVAGANEAVARARLAKAVIRAPFSGVVGQKKVAPGAYLRAGDPITDLASVDVVKVAFAAPERYLGRLSRGSQVEVTTPAYPNETFAGQITVVNPLIDPETRTVQLLAEIPNRGRLLKPGMSANVAITLSERWNALAVPDEAVFAEGTQNYVYVVKPDSSVTRTAIQIGSRDSSRVEVIAGLAVGQRVVRAGYQKLYEGAHVMPVPDLNMLTGGGPPGMGAPSGGAGKGAASGGKQAPARTPSQKSGSGSAR